MPVRIKHSVARLTQRDDSYCVGGSADAVALAVIIVVELLVAALRQAHYRSTDTLALGGQVVEVYILSGDMSDKGSENWDGDA